MTTKPNAANERVKRDYFLWLREAHGRDAATVDGVAASLARFERSTKGRDFKRFRQEQAVAFKRGLASESNPRTGKAISKATMHAILRDLRAFFGWLAREPGFRQSLNYTDADYFNLTDKDVAQATARREPNPPTLDQVRRAIMAMPGDTVLERRDRALIAFTMLTGARANALASFRLGHANVAEGYVDQDASAVRTKAAKTFRTYFMPVDDVARRIVDDWCAELLRDHAWGPGDPLFPQTALGLSAAGSFTPVGIQRRGWATSQPVREIFQRAFAAAGLPYFNPHSFRAMLVRHYMAMGLSAEQMKAISQNLGHADVLTTFTSYGQVPTHRQGELIRATSRAQLSGAHDPVLAMREALKTIETQLRKKA